MTMDTTNIKVQCFKENLCGVLDWGLSSSQKLIALAIFASIIAVLIDWSLLIVLIATVILIVYLTDRTLSVGWFASRDPLAQVLSGLERFRGKVKSFYCRVFNSNDVLDTETQELRKRSESIASSHIPDLDIDVESSGPGSSFQKKIRLELNSIVLLIIRDFVQFWYNTFSYNSQFLKDARQFLFRGFHNFVERISRLGPHKTSAKLIHAYRKHLACFQTAKNIYNNDRDKTRRKHPQNHQKIGAKTNLTGLESVDKGFPVNFQLHPALKSAEAEKQYVRSLTKVILLCCCSRDVVTAQSAHLFFIEVLSMNVVLPVLHMLSNPDRLYELLIKLTYNDDNAILNNDTIRELVDLEVKRMQLRDNAGDAAAATPSSSLTVTPQALTGSCENTSTCTDAGQSSHNSGQSAVAAASDVDKDKSLKSECTSASQVSRQKSKTGVDPVDVQTSDIAGELVPQNTSPQVSAEEKGGSSATEKSEEASGKDSANCAEPSVDSTGAEQTQRLFKTDDLDVVAEEVEPQDSDKSPSSDSAESVPAQINHIYDEIVSTGVPIIKPKLQVFKDLFKSKKARLAEEAKLQNAADRDQACDAQSETNSKSSSESSSSSSSILPTPRLKSLRLSPLLNRSGKFSLSSLSSSDSSSSLSKQSGKDSGAKGKGESGADSGTERRSPSPQPTPSPSQPTKGGPLSFFKFRKPSLDFRKSSSSALAEEKTSDLPSSNLREEKALTSEQPSSSSLSSSKTTTTTTRSAATTPTPTVPTVHISGGSPEANGPVNNRLRSSSSGSGGGNGGGGGGGSSSSSARSPQSPVVWELNPEAMTEASSQDQQSMGVSVSSYMEEMTESPDLKTPTTQPGNGKLFPGSGAGEGGEEVVEEGEEAECLEGMRAGGGVLVGEEGDVTVVATPPDSSLIFQDISIPSTMTCQEYRSNAQFTVYQIEYEALHFSETGIPVMKTGTAKRRYREFVNLMSRLEDNPAYKRMLKDVKGPKRWLTLPFKNMDKESVAGRQSSLEHFLKSLIELEAVCNGPEMREFLAYEGDSHIAFVKKSTEINVPRIDKMLARTVSGVFDKLKSLPNLPQEVMSGIRGRETIVDRKDSTETDTDSLSVVTDFALDFPHDLSFSNMLRDVSESYVREVQTLGHPELLPASPTARLLQDMAPPSPPSPPSLSDQILLHLPRVQGDGAEHPDDATESGGPSSLGSGHLSLCDAVLDLAVQLLTSAHQHQNQHQDQHQDQDQDQHPPHWLCYHRCLTALRNILGPTLDRWVRETVSSLTTEERCLYYIRLLRETVWPGGQLFSSSSSSSSSSSQTQDDSQGGEGEEGDDKTTTTTMTSEGKSEEEKKATRTVAKRLLMDSFPDYLLVVLGADSLEGAVDVIMESLQYSQLNKHFLYSTIDMLLESLFPEIADPQFQSRLLPRP